MKTVSAPFLANPHFAVPLLSVVREKKRLYDSLKECKGGGIVYPTDFFRFKSKYYMITPKIEMSSITIEEISKLDTNTKIMICKVIANNMIAIQKKELYMQK